MSYDGLVYYLLFRYCWGHLLFFNRIISIHTTTSVSRRLKILCIMFKIIVFFVIVLTFLAYYSPFNKNWRSFVSPNLLSAMQVPSIVSKMPTLTYNQANSTIKCDIFFSFCHFMSFYYYTNKADHHDIIGILLKG
jgi:hypothetical protein